jgi:hypothetical protein
MRLEVAMHDADRVRRGQAGDDSARDANCLGRRQVSEVNAYILMDTVQNASGDFTNNPFLADAGNGEGDLRRAEIAPAELALRCLRRPGRSGQLAPEELFPWAAGVAHAAAGW